MLVAILAAAGVIVHFTRGVVSNAASPLCGVYRFDFGRVDLSDGPRVLEHVFELTNCSAQAIQITRTVSSCGCTTATVTQEAVQPGAVVAIPTRLNLSGPGAKFAQVHLELAGSGVPRQTLEVCASGYLQRQLSLLSGVVSLDRRRPCLVKMFATNECGSQAPERPTLTTPEGVISSSGDWRLVHEGDAAAGLPTRWEIDVAFEWAFDAEWGSDKSGVFGTIHSAGYPEQKLRFVRRDPKSR